jgi:Ca2+-binding RTX toxin-like protein
LKIKSLCKAFCLEIFFQIALRLFISKIGRALLEAHCANADGKGGGVATISGGDYYTDSHTGDVMQGYSDGDNIFGFDGYDTIYGGTGSEYVDTTGDYNQIFGGTGDDSIQASGSGDYITGGSGDDTITTTGSGNDTIQGGSGNDTITIGGSNNSVQGGSGNTFIQGGQGNDTVVAGTGNTTIAGGAGNETFVFNSNGGKNVVMNFHDGDVLQIQANINGLNIQSANDLVAHITDDNGNAVITLGHESITLVGVSATDLHNNPQNYFSIH